MHAARYNNASKKLCTKDGYLLPTGHLQTEDVETGVNNECGQIPFDREKAAMVRLPPENLNGRIQPFVCSTTSANLLLIIAGETTTAEKAMESGKLAGSDDVVV
ncbi:hypothetical protein Y032_0638g967 [Ancylostoma ceylanicum]|uniref:Uncharacterized protein n=1 Tax=Ancylostoma ceylanicum TaxID=53326 RepID=A0A016WJM5_9BILA|nr:hypothetical protein Y032_0638g967 [Ancylostoma ceylanicum]